MSKISSKQVAGYIRLQIAAQKAAPSQKIGAALGQKGLNIMEFCRTFNDKTKTFDIETPVRVRITAYVDKSFALELKGIPTSYLIRKAAGAEKGSSAPGRISQGSVSYQQLETIAQQQMPYLSARTVDQAVKILAGSAKSMGIKVTGMDAIGGKNG